MIFSEIKIRDLAKLPKKITLDQIINAINSIGFEVESVTPFSDLEGIKFGEIKNHYKNTNSDNLTVCEIEFNDKKRIIQTTAKNIENNFYVIAFVPGSRSGNIVFGEKKLKGILSEGMLAGLDELGFEDEFIEEKYKDNIFLFKKEDMNFTLSDDPIKVLSLNDNLIDVSILTNRSDALSYEIMSREIAAYFNIEIKEEKIKIENFKSKQKILSNNEIFLNGVEVKKTNQNNLKLLDKLFVIKNKLKSSTEVEYIKNLVYLYSGVYSRIFDKEKIGEIIKITKGTKNDSGITFLSSKNKKISVLGVEEDINFKENNTTSNAIFEFSQIESKIVRDNTKKTKKSTISSINASRNISSGSILLAQKYISLYFKNTSYLINEIEKKQKTIKFEKEYLKNYIGKDISSTRKYFEAINSLKILGFKFVSNKVLVPLYRHDISTMQDLVEEIIRFYGINNITPSKPLNSFLKVSSNNDLESRISKMNYFRFYSYTLVNEEEVKFNPFGFKNNISLLTFTSKEHAFIRNSIAVSLNKIYLENKKRKLENYNFFDIGMINEKKSLTLASDKKEYREILGDIFSIFNADLKIEKLDNEMLHPNYSASINYKGEMIGWIGKFNPFYVDSNVIYVEILLTDNLLKQEINFVPYNKEPLKERDVTFTINENESVRKMLEKFNGFNLFEIKKNPNIFFKDGQKKITYNLKISEEEIEKFDKEFNNEN